MTKKKKWLDKENVNLMVAVCAVLISAASFYATYIQSTAAERQVKAETWPYVQLRTGNYDVNLREFMLYLRIHNAGVGPAHLKRFQLFYKGQPIPTINQALSLCCLEEGEKVRDENGQVRPKFNNIVTGNPAPGIVPAGEQLLVFSILKNAENADLWEKLDAARADFTAEGCYCSLLDECYRTDFESEPVEVDFCPVPGREN